MKVLFQIINEGFDFFYQIFRNRSILFALSSREFKKTYINNFFGLIWAILDPLAFVVIMYMVFGARYSDKDPGAIQFYIYLITGYIAFDMFSNTLTSVTTTIKEHSFLLKKVNFRVAILPIVSLLSKLMMHGIIMILCISVLLINKIWPAWMWFQVFYYLLALSMLLVATGWLTSSIYLFFPDIKNIISIITRIMFFVSPIFWNMDGLPQSSQFILKLNPVYYIVSGYRDSLLYNTGFWLHPRLTLYFWAFCLAILFIGVIVFKKLRPHFADVVA